MIQASDDLPPYMTVAQVATLLRVTRQTVLRWVRSEKLEAVKAGKQWRIRPVALEAFLQTPAPAGRPWSKKLARG